MHLNLQLLLAAVVVAAAMASSLEPSNVQDSCETSCGNVTIEFPFGSGEGCYHTSNFLVTCDRSSGEPILFFGEKTTNVSITNISITAGEMDIMIRLVAYDCYNTSGRTQRNNPSLSLRDFSISTKNSFVAIGCDTLAYISGKRRGNESDLDIGTGCISTCSSYTGITNGSRSGVGWCQVAIPDRMRYVDIILSSYYNNHANISDFNPCSYGFVVQQDKFTFSTNNLHDFGSVKKLPMLVDWAIGNETCEIARKDTDKFLCKGNTSECVEDYGGPGYRCRCKHGYAGNPYIQDNCTNINECEDGHNGGCEHECVDFNGGYVCRCPKGYKQDGTGCIAEESLVIRIVVGTLAAAIFLLTLLK